MKRVYKPLNMTGEMEAALEWVTEASVEMMESLQTAQQDCLMVMWIFDRRRVAVWRKEQKEAAK